MASDPRDSGASLADDEERSLSLGGMVARWMKRLVVACLLVTGLGALTLWLVLAHYEDDLPSTADLKNYDPPQVTRVLARDGSVLAEVFTERRTVVPVSEVPKELKVSVLAAEDADFYKHEGLDYFGMLRALWVNVRTQRARQGGSTITQQVVKNVLLTPERTFERKARELLLARRIEQELSKDEILELYLNHIYFGHGRYGIEEASRYYFGKGVAEVTLAEAALLAGLPKGPGIYSPRVDYARALERRNTVLDQIAAKGFATSARIERTKAEPIVLAPAVEALAELAPEVVAEVRRELKRIVGPAAARGGFTVHTTIDPDLQAAARKALRQNLDAYSERHSLLGPLPKHFGRDAVPFQGTPVAKGHKIYNAVVIGADDEARMLLVRVGNADGRVKVALSSRYNPKNLPPSRFAKKGTILRVSPVPERAIGPGGVPREYRLELGPQSALVALDVKSREVRALIGSYEGVRGRLDRATYARRQPGSTFKSFVYSYGIHSRRITAATVVLLPQKAGTPEGAPPLLVRDAVAKSVNDAATWALDEVGPESVVAWAQSMGIESHLAPTKSLALGAYEVTPRELVAAYATFPGQGLYRAPVLITKVVAPSGKDVRLADRLPARRVMSKSEAYVVASLLSSVVQRGTARTAAAVKLPLAGKTGTSNDARDAWFAGFTPEIACVVWTGFDDNVPLGRGEYGAKAALPAFIAFMKRAHEGRTVNDFERPSGIVKVLVDPLTGLLAYDDQEDAIEEIFLAGTEPQDQAEDPDAGDELEFDAGHDPYDELEFDAGVDSDTDPEAVGPGSDPALQPERVPASPDPVPGSEAELETELGPEPASAPPPDRDGPPPF